MPEYMDDRCELCDGTYHSDDYSPAWRLIGPHAFRPRGGRAVKHGREDPSGVSWSVWRRGAGDDSPMKQDWTKGLKLNSGGLEGYHIKQAERIRHEHLNRAVIKHGYLATKRSLNVLANLNVNHAGAHETYRRDLKWLEETHSKTFHCSYSPEVLFRRELAHLHGER